MARASRYVCKIQVLASPPRTSRALPALPAARRLGVAPPRRNRHRARPGEGARGVHGRQRRGGERAGEGLSVLGAHSARSFDGELPMSQRLAASVSEAAPSTRVPSSAPRLVAGVEEPGRPIPRARRGPILASRGWCWPRTNPDCGRTCTGSWPRSTRSWRWTMARARSRPRASTCPTSSCPT